MITDESIASQRVLDRLRAEHAELIALVDDFLAPPSSARRARLLPQICAAVRLHYTVETGVFLSAYARAGGSAELLEKAGAEYATVIAVVNELAQADPADRAVVERMALLGRRIREHIQCAEAATGVLATACALDIPWQALNRHLLERREQLSCAIAPGRIPVDRSLPPVAPFSM